MSQSAIQDKITAIRVQWTLKWAERNVALVRCPDEAWMRHIQQKDWNNSLVKTIIDIHSDDIEILTLIEATLHLAPQCLQAEVDAVIDDDDDSYESDYGETEDEEEEINDDPQVPPQHLVLEPNTDDDPMNMD